ncbi:MAG TPA: restriction endonuclease fold toxin-2 domain-containing protein [Myxococcaceae bacterium]|nr:restriction endonuclease fold toxin-2 domain-containing protein [Myxococcaceae bacterium]
MGTGWKSRCEEKGGGEEVWADGARLDDAHLLEVKHVEKPDSSPFIAGSTCEEFIRSMIREKERIQLKRYAAVIADPETPAVGLEIIVNDARAAPFFELLMHELGIPGRVVIRP